MGENERGKRRIEYLNAVILGNGHQRMPLYSNANTIMPLTEKIAFSFLVFASIRKNSFKLPRRGRWVYLSLSPH